MVLKLKIYYYPLTQSQKKEYMLGNWNNYSANKEAEL